MKKKEALQYCYSTIDNIVKTQNYFTRKWHTDVDFSASKKDDIIQNAIMNHFMNFQLWHTEDIARSNKKSDKTIANCKRKIDLLNQKRTDFYELVDDSFAYILKDFIVSNAPCNTESIGSIVDRLSILSLKIYHMSEEKKRRTRQDADYQAVSDKVAFLLKQRQDLISAFKFLIKEIFDGTKKPLLYKQFKMYNEKTLNPVLYKQKH